MSERHAWVIEIEAALGRIEKSQWLLEATLLRVQADYRVIAETIKAAMSANPELNQKLVANHIGKSAAWVSRTLRWHTEGCKSGSPFADEIAARRRASKTEAKFATSQLEEIAADADLGQGSFFDSNGHYFLDCAEAPLFRERKKATFKIMSLMGACQALKNAADLDRTSLALVRSSDIDERVFTLEKLESDLTKSIAAGTRALEEVRAVLKDTPEFLEAAE